MSGSIRILKRNGLKGWTWVQVVGWLKIPSMGSFCGSLCESSPQGSNRFLFQDLQRGEGGRLCCTQFHQLFLIFGFSHFVYTMQYALRAIAKCPTLQITLSLHTWGWHNISVILLAAIQESSPHHHIFDSERSAGGKGRRTLGQHFLLKQFCLIHPVEHIQKSKLPKLYVKVETSTTYFIIHNQFVKNCSLSDQLFCSIFLQSPSRQQSYQIMDCKW